MVRHWTLAAIVLVGILGCTARVAEPVRRPEPTPIERPPAQVATEPEQPKSAARGRVTVLAVTRLPKFLTVLRERVYWSNGYGELSSVSTRGGEVIVHHEPGQEGALANVVTTDGEAVYFATMRGIYRLRPGERTATRIIDRPDTLSVAVDEGYIYFTVFGKRELWRSDKDGGGQTPIARSKMAGSLKAAGGYLYWNSYASGTVHRVARAGGRGEVLGRGRAPTSLAVSGDRVVWGTERAGELFVKEPGKRPRRLYVGARNHDVIAVDEEYVYFGSWIPQGKGQIARVPLAGGAADILADELRSPVGIAAWGDALFVANKGEDTILRIEKSSTAP